MIQAQATIVGYAGKPCTLFSAYNEESEILVISKDTDFRRERREGCFVITNDPDIERDALFTEEQFHEAIGAYYALAQGISMDGKSSKLAFLNQVQRANPAQSIEKDGMDANGQKYRISENISCLQIAALATCWHFNQRFGTVQKMLDLSEQILELERFHYGDIITI